MTDQHPITPPPELIDQWGREFLYGPPTGPAESHAYIATRAAQWGANTELTECCKCIYDQGWFANPQIKITFTDDSYGVYPVPNRWIRFWTRVFFNTKWNFEND